MSNQTLGSALGNATEAGPTVGYTHNSTTTTELSSYNQTTGNSTKHPPYIRTTWNTASGELFNTTTVGDSAYNQTTDFTPYDQNSTFSITNDSISWNDTSPSDIAFNLTDPNNPTSNYTASDLYVFNSTVEFKALNTTDQTGTVQASTVASEFVQYAKSTRDHSIFEILYSVGELNNDSWLYNTTDNLTDYNGTGVVQINIKHPALGVFLSMFVVVVIIGNLLVIGAVARERYLRSVTNYLIVSLAVADLLVGGIVMPFSIVLEMTSGVWLFPHVWCDLWHSFDVLGSTGSILNLCVIALDRYWAITDPIAYPSKMSCKRVWILISLVWVCSAAISFPAILWWRAVSPQLSDYECVFSEDSGYLIISSIVSFYTPLIIMLFVYYRIYKAATARTKSLMTGTKIIAPDGLRGEVMTLRIHRGKAAVRNGHGHDHVNYHRPAYTDTETDSPSHMTRSDSDDNENRPSRFIKKKIQKFAIGRKLSKLAKEQKAAKTLGIVMGVFIICWVPFFFTNVLWAICSDNCVMYPNVFFPIFTWLGYLNSGMNPIIYALSMRDFRRAFRRLLCSCCPSYTIRTKAVKMFQVRSMSTSSFTGSVCAGERFSTMRL